MEEALYLSEKIFVLTGNPVSSLKIVDVPLERKRSIKMLENENIRQLKDRLVEMLRREAKE